MTKKKVMTDVIATNRKAQHDFIIEETIECGLVLTGTEIKSLREGRASLKESFARIDRNGEVWLYQSNIPIYKQGNRYNHEPNRARKLLLKKKEIFHLQKAVERQGYTLVALKMYIKRGYAKLLLGVGKGKKLYDKRLTLKERDMKRDIERSMRAR